MDPSVADAGPMRRLFFALWPPAELQQQLYEIGGTLLHSAHARRLPAENLHLTLAFLGEVAPMRQACYERAADGVAGRPFTLAFERSGCFRRTGVLWVGPDETPAALAALAGALNAALEGCGYRPDTRPLRAHLTLARRLRRCPPPATFAPLAWPVREFALVESRLERDGARYERRRVWSLG
jgi:2'-5' RNA ligase